MGKHRVYVEKSPRSSTSSPWPGVVKKREERQEGRVSQGEWTVCVRSWGRTEKVQGKKVQDQAFKEPQDSEAEQRKGCWQRRPRRGGRGGRRESGGYGTADTKRRKYLKRRIVYCVMKCYRNHITHYYYINSASKSAMSTEDKRL